MRAIAIDYDTGIQTDFGYGRAFAKPDDWVLTSAVCTDEWFRTPALRYVDEAQYWYADVDTLYVRYVSDDALYGMNMNKWPDSFREFVEVHFATKIIAKLSNSEEETQRLMRLRRDFMDRAKSKAAMAQPTSFPAQGSWTRARNRFPNRRDGGGQTGNLIG